MPNQKSAKFSILAFALALMSFSPSAHAGFEWIAPQNGMPYQAPAVIAPADGNRPAAASAPEIISPVIITGNTDAPSHTGSKSATVTSKPNLATASLGLSPNAGSDTISGFGLSIPLTLALHQIVPADYGSSIDPDVDMNTLVSYKGGKSWRDTLRDALTPVGLTMREEGAMVIVSRTPSPVATDKPAPTLMPIEAGQTISRAPAIVASVDNGFSTSAPSSWDAQRGDTLHKVLGDWCRRAGIELQWQAEYDYPVEASAHFASNFEDAVRNLLAGFDTARPQPIGELHSNTNAGQTVLVVQARGNNYSN